MKIFLFAAFLIGSLLANSEIPVGQFLGCVGSCDIYQGRGHIKAKFKTHIFGREEIETGKDSYAWLMLNDGTLIRLSPESNLTINELVNGKEEFFINARLAKGHIYWLTRSLEKEESDLIPETDQLFIPFSLYEANPITDISNENFYDQTLDKRMDYAKNQRDRLHELLLENKADHKSTSAFIVLPNATLVGKNLHFHAVTKMKEKSFIKVYSDNVEMGLRVEKNNDFIKINKDEWIGISDLGLKSWSIAGDDDLKYALSPFELIVKNISTVLIAREIMLKSIAPLDEITMDTNRINYLKEYYYRLEKNNLANLDKFIFTRKMRGEKMEEEIFENNLEKYYQLALTHYRQFMVPMIEPKRGLNSEERPLWKRMHGIR